MNAALGAAIGVGGGAASAQDWSVTPRYWYYFDNVNQRQSGIDSASIGGDDAAALLEQSFETWLGEDISVTEIGATTASAANQDAIPLAGGTIAFDWFGSDNTQVSLTALHGESERNVRSLTTGEFEFNMDGFIAQDIQNIETTIKGTTKRSDIEIAVQHRVNQTFSVLYGVRHEHNEELATADLKGSATPNALNLAEDLYGFGFTNYQLLRVSNKATTQFSNDIISLRFGGAAYAPIGGKHVVYVNGLIHATQALAGESVTVFDYEDPDIEDTELLQEFDSETMVGPDISVGYLFRFNDRIGLDLRYRGIFYFPVDGAKEIEDPRVNHGLNIGLSIWFGA